MGGIQCNGYQSDKEAAEINRQINQQLAKERRLQSDDYKLLLLGTGESGKSTMTKQMKIIHLAGFTKEEKLSFARVIINSVVIYAQTLLLHFHQRNLSPSSLREEEIEEIRKIEVSKGFNYTPDLAKTISKFWNDDVTQTLYSSLQYSLPDSFSYFLGQAERIGEEGFTPTELDILKVRIKTTGIVETPFQSSSNRFRMVDVGGQRNERKKWIHCFTDVTAIIFCVATNEYDLMLEEDNTVNRMHESLRLFGEIINNEFFWNTKIILLLNKEDLLKEKSTKVDLSLCFPNYDGGLNFDNASKYIQRKFLEKNKNQNRKIYAKFACATDTTNIRYVFSLLEQFLMEDLLKNVF